MKKRLPMSVKNKLKKLGNDLNKARLRRRLKMEVIADRAGISKATLAKIQKGDPGVAIGSYVTVISAIGLGSDWLNFADIKNDKVGLLLDEKRIPMRARD